MKKLYVNTYEWYEVLRIPFDIGDSKKGGITSAVQKPQVLL